MTWTAFAILDMCKGISLTFHCIHHIMYLRYTWKALSSSYSGTGIARKRNQRLIQDSPTLETMCVEVWAVWRQGSNPGEDYNNEETLVLQSVIARQAGTSFKNKSHGKDQVRANKRAIKEMPCLTSFQLKMNLCNCLAKVSPRTIRRILLKILEMPCRVALKKPF